MQAADTHTKPLTVVVTRRLPASVQARLSDLFDTHLNEDDVPFTREQLTNAMSKADILVSSLNDRIDADLIASAGDQLRLIANYGSGYDHIDVAAAHARGIQTSNSPSSDSADTADMAIALILAVMRRFKEGSNVMSSGEWTGWSPSAFLGARVTGKKLGILGMGRVGTQVARRARAFGMEIHYHNRSRVHAGIEEAFGATYWTDLKDMLGQVDILSLNCAVNSETVHIMNAETLAQLPKGAFLINTARGELVDETALLSALESGHLAGAGLDVLARGADMNSGLQALPNVMLLPHMGSATDEARREMGETVIYNIKMLEDGHTPPNLIIPSMV